MAKGQRLPLLRGKDRHAGRLAGSGTPQKLDCATANTHRDDSKKALSRARFLLTGLSRI
jgi:hypothetical protein